MYARIPQNLLQESMTQGTRMLQGVKGPQGRGEKTCVAVIREKGYKCAAPVRLGE